MASVNGKGYLAYSEVVLLGVFFGSRRLKFRKSFFVFGTALDVFFIEAVSAFLVIFALRFVVFMLLP